MTLLSRQAPIRRPSLGQFEAGAQAQLDEQGSLVIATEGGEVKLHKARGVADHRRQAN